MQRKHLSTYHVKIMSAPTCVVGDSPVGDSSRWHLTPDHSVGVEASESKGPRSLPGSGPMWTCEGCSPPRHRIVTNSHS